MMLQVLFGSSVYSLRYDGHPQMPFDAEYVSKPAPKNCFNSYANTAKTFMLNDKAVFLTDLMFNF